MRTEVRWLRRFCALMLAIASATTIAQAPPPSQWKGEIDALVADDAAHPPAQNGVVFVGSSSIRLWTSTLATDFPGIPVLDRGFGGSILADSTYYVDRIVVPYHPKVVVLYAGDNDIFAGHTAAQVFDDFKAFVARVRQDLPHTAIVYIAIKPSTSRWKLWPAMREANERIAAWSKTQQDVRFVDIVPAMLDADGKPRPDLLREDGLHMNAKGYAIWIDALKPVLAAYGFKTR